MNLCVLQGNIVAIKYTNKKRIELNRKVLFELKHVSLYVCSGSYQSILSSSTGEQVATLEEENLTNVMKQRLKFSI